MDVRSHNEYLGTRGGSYDGGWGAGVWFFAIIVILIIFAFIFKRGHGENGFDGIGGILGLKALDGCSPCKPKPLVPASCCEVEKGFWNIDKDVIKEADKTREYLSNKLERKWELEAQEKFARQLATEVELKGKIYQLENKGEIDKKFNELAFLMQRDYGLVQKHLDRIECEMPRIEKCTIPVCPPRCVSGQSCRDRDCNCN